MQAHHDHARVPEKKNVVAADQQARGIKRAQIGGVVRPAERGKGPQAGAEPRVEHVGILRELRAAALRAFRGDACGARVAFHDFDARIERRNHFLAIGAMPDGNAMAPPELARDAPVANIFEPVRAEWCADFRGPLRSGRRARLACAGSASGFILHEPLRGNARLDYRICSGRRCRRRA